MGHAAQPAVTGPVTIQAGGAAPASGWLERHAPAVAILLILGVGLPLRLLGLSASFTGFHSWNEAHYAMIAHNFVLTGPFAQYDDLGLDATTTPFVPWLIAASWAVLGASEWAARLPILLGGLLSLWLVFLLARRLYDGATALLALALAAVLPDIVYFSRNVQLDAPRLACILAAAVALLSYRRRGRPGAFALVIGALTLAYLCKWDTLLALPFLGAVWLAGGPRGALPRRLTWPRALTAIVVPPLPALAWLMWGLAQAPAYEHELITSYLFRGAEWSGPALQQALAAITLRLTANLTVFLLILLPGLVWVARVWRRHLPGLLLACSVLPQLRYPISFRENIYYLYPALYGLALLTAAIALAALRWRPAGRPQPLLVAMVAGTLLLGAVLTIANDLHFARANAAGFPRQVAVARALARSLRPGDAVLVEAQDLSPPLMYYLGGDPRRVLAHTLFPGCLPLSSLTRSHFYRSILFALPPSASTAALLAANGYRPLQYHMLWQLQTAPARLPRPHPWLAAPAAVARATCPWLTR